MDYLGSFTNLGWAHLCIFSQLEGWLEAGCSMMALFFHVSLIFQQASPDLFLWWWQDSRVNLVAWENKKRCIHAFKPQISWHYNLSYKTSHTSEQGFYRMIGKGCGYKQDTETLNAIILHQSQSLQYGGWVNIGCKGENNLPWVD